MKKKKLIEDFEIQGKNYEVYCDMDAGAYGEDGDELLIYENGNRIYEYEDDLYEEIADRIFEAAEKVADYHVKMADGQILDIELTTLFWSYVIVDDEEALNAQAVAFDGFKFVPFITIEQVVEDIMARDDRVVLTQGR